MDSQLFTEQAHVERKTLSFELRENPRGRFLRITEDVGGRRDTIIIPAAGLELVKEIFSRAIVADKKAGPAKVTAED